jgi:hypothetical protein
MLMQGISSTRLCAMMEWQRRNAQRMAHGDVKQRDIVQQQLIGDEQSESGLWHSQRDAAA